MPLTRADHEIIAYLRSNARHNLTQISRATRIPISTIFDKLKRLETTIIMRYTPLLDYHHLGLERKHLLVKTTKQDRDAVLKLLLHHPNVNTLSRVDNKFDYLVEVIFAKPTEYYAFLDQLENYTILYREEYAIVDDLKREAYLTKNPPHLLVHA